MSGYERPARQLFVVVECGAARMRMRLVPVQDGGERLAVVNRGLGIVPLEILGESDDRALAEVYHVFRRLELSDTASVDDAERLASTFAAWRDALGRSGIDLRLERSTLYGVPLPRTDWQAGAPGVSARPWDVELTALSAGLRKIVKLDGVPADFVEKLRDIVEQRGLQVEVVAPEHAVADAVDPSVSVTLLVGRDASTLGEARAVEKLLLIGGAAPAIAAATLRMGELLGYPRCCADRFTRIAGQNDTTLAWTLLPGVPHPPASPLMQWLHPALALLSHSPCDLHCGASLVLGERLLEAIEGAQHGFAAPWRELTARVHAVDHRGRRLALVVDGRLEAGATIITADVVAGSADPDAVTGARWLVGRIVRSASGGLVIDDGSWHAPYVADHRGQP